MHTSSSALIKENSHLEFDAHKLTATPDKNQLVLLSALKKLNSKKINILLDGHFSLVNKNGDIEKIDIEVFRKMCLDGVILISESASTIRKRVYTRDGVSISYDLEKLIENESENAMSITNGLNIPLVILKSPSKDDFLQALKMLGMT